MSTTSVEVGYNVLLTLDIERVLDLVPPPVMQQMQNHGVVLAGGAIRSIVAHDPIKDIDIFCHGKEQAKALAQSHGVPVKTTFCAYSVELEDAKIQYIYYKEFTTPLDLISAFDFLACCAAIYWENGWKGIALDGFYADCFEKKLTFRKHPKDLGQLCPLRRAFNFAANGWDVSDETLADIIIHWQKGQEEQTAILEPISVKCASSYYREEILRSFAPAYGSEARN